MSSYDFINNTGGGAVLGGPSTVVGGHFINNRNGGLGTDRDTIISGTMFISNSADIGGGLYANYTATLYNTHFEGNTATTYGGGLFAEHTYIISGADFINNTAANGGGAAIGEIQFISNTTFIGNSASQDGGGLWAGSQSASLVNVLFARNSVSHGKAIVRLSATNNIDLMYTTVASPTASDAIAVSLPSGTLHVTNTIVANYAYAFTHTDTTVYEDYNVFAARVTNGGPIVSGGHSQLATPDFADPLHDDYHLQFGSAAIDHGVDVGVYTDLDGNPRPIGAGFDIGAYEFIRDTRYVATTGKDAANDCLNGVSPCATIQHAIDVANDDEQVLIASGLYTQSATLYKPVSLTGVSSDTTIIHAVAGQRVLTVTGVTISNSVVISGLTFTGGATPNGVACPSGCGGGIYSVVPLNVLNSRFLSNTAAHFGGGMYANVTDISNSRFEGNTADDGGGIYAIGTTRVTNTVFLSNTGSGAYFGNVAVYDSRFEGNTTGGWGGGMRAGNLYMSGTMFLNNSAHLGGGGGLIGNGVILGSRFENNTADGCGRGVQEYGHDTLVIANSQFIGNTSGACGGGVCRQDSHAVGTTQIVNVLFADNVAPHGAAPYFNDIWYHDLHHLTIVSSVPTTPSAIAIVGESTIINDTIIANHGIGISNTGGIVSEDYNLFFGNVTNTLGLITNGGHSLIGEPRFVDPLHDDYHLQFGSAAIDHGVDAGVATDLDGHQRPIGLSFDIGAYEYQSIRYLWLPVIRK